MNKRTTHFRRHLFLCIFLCSSFSASAYDALTGGIYYDLDVESRTASVTHSSTNVGFSTDYIGEIVIPESITVDGVSYSVTSIGKDAFSKCDQLTSLSIPRTINTIDEAFSPINYKNLVKLNIVDLSAWCNINFVNSYTNPLYYATNLYINNQLATDIEIPNGVTKISDRLFRGCRSLKSITIPESVTVIGEAAFDECSQLASVVVKDGVTTIGKNAFADCKNLTSINLPNTVTFIGSLAFTWCENLTSFVIPDRVTSIESRTFEYCKKLESVTVPEGVLSIGYQAFMGCNLKSIVLPSSVTSIEWNAFSGCNLTAVYSLPTTPPDVDENSFDEETYNEATLYVPMGCKESYESYAVAESAKISALRREEGIRVWNLFNTIVEITPDMTSIETMEQQRGKPSFVYSIQGVKVSDDAEALKQLPRGIYIVNGKKVAVK